MSEDLGVLIKRYTRRSNAGIYTLACFGGAILTWIIFLIIVNFVPGTGLLILIVPGVDFVILIANIIVYNVLKDTSKAQLRRCLDTELIVWKMQAVEDSINSIQTAAPVPLINIETYAHNILFHKFATEYPRLNLQKLGILFPNTVYILQQLLAQKPFLGTYYQVEQQFVKNFTDSPAHSLTLTKKS